MKTTSRASAEILRPFLPAPLIRAWSENPGRAPVWSERLNGSLMHCDVTGFTAMSERLAERSKEGAEIMVDVLNQFFERMLGIADTWGGEQIKFGGDAMLLLFTSAEHAASAACCALEMQRAMSDFRNLRAGGEEHRLRMRIGIHSGSAFIASVGDEDNLLHFMITGPDVNRTAEVEPAAAPGCVALSLDTAAILNGAARLSPLGNDLFTLRAVTGSCPIVERAPPGRVPRSLERYLHPALRERASEIARPGGEHRRVTVMFLNLLGLSKMIGAGDETGALEAANGYVRLLLRSLGSHGGFLLGSDASDHGDKFIALFGAPVSQAEPEASAMLCALDLIRGLNAVGLPVKQRIGINSGFVFAGEVGSAKRKEFTVIGDAVNLSARLMTAARWGEVIVSEETLHASSEPFEARPMKALRVKGKAAPIKARRLQGPPSISTQNIHALVGRDMELRRLVDWATRGRQPHPVCAHVSGEAGIGKSRLIAELASGLRSRGWRVLSGQCYAHTAHVPYGAWTGLLRALFELSPGDGVSDLDAALTRLAPDHPEASQVLADLMSLPQGASIGQGDLDAESARRYLTNTVVTALSSVAGDQPLLLIVDDVHWIDERSAALLRDVLSEATGRVAVVTGSREATPISDHARKKSGLVLKLQPLSPDAARRLVGATGIDEDGMAAVLDRGRGNPLMLSAFAQGRSDDGGNIPETVEDAVLSRVDVLSVTLRNTVRAAAVVGPTFDAGALTSILEPQVSRRVVNEALRDLSVTGLINAYDEDRFGFTHSVLREVVYETLPYSQRRRMHGRVVQHIEVTRASHIDTVCEELLHHAGLAEDAARTVRYACLSGDRAARMYAGDAAVSYYNRALATLSELSRPATADRSVLLERMGDCVEAMGRHREAATLFEESLQTWGADRGKRLRFLPGNASDPVRPAALCRKTAVSLERAADFDASLRWLDRALELIPPGKPRMSAEISGARSATLMRFGRYEEGVEWGRRAVQMANRSRDRRLIAYSHNMLAKSYMELGDLRRAVRHLRDSVRIYHELGDFQGQASANNNLGMCYHLQGTLDAALYYYQVALQTDQRVGDLVDAMIVGNNMGEVQMVLGRLPEAIESLERVVAAHESHGGLTGVAGLAHVNLARCFMRSDIDLSRRHLRIGMRLLRQAGQMGLVAEAQLEKAQLLLIQCKSRQAQAAARAALAQARNLGARLLEARGERILGEGLALDGRLIQAEVHLKASVALAREIAASHEEARSLLALARVVMKSGRRARAVSLLNRAQKEFQRIGARLEAEEAGDLLGKARG